MVFRILPVLIILLTMMIGSRFIEFISETSLIIPEIKASDAPPAEPPAEEKKDAKPEDAKPEKEKKEGDEANHGEEKKADSKSEDGHEKPKEDDAPKERNDLQSIVKDKKPEEAAYQFTKIEAEILQSLVKRREDLELREKDISLKEASLMVIEKNIDDKITQLEGLQGELKGILAEYSSKEDEKIKGLVKTYESMKPADAAKIFEQLQMSVLLDVADNMKEVKLAQVLAKMDTYKAKELTVEIANRRRLKN